MDQRDCPTCHAPLTWVPSNTPGFKRGTWEGEHESWCSVGKSKARHDASTAIHTNEVSVEDVIGPTGAPVYAVTASVGKVKGGLMALDTFHVRAATKAGALLLAHEVRLFMVDAVAEPVVE